MLITSYTNSGRVLECRHRIVYACCKEVYRVCIHLHSKTKTTTTGVRNNFNYTGGMQTLTMFTAGTYTFLEPDTTAQYDSNAI